MFYDPSPVREQEVTISLRRKYVCHSGIWTETMYSQRLSNHRGGPIGAILRETDRRLRLSLRVTPKMSPKPMDKEMQNAIQQVINDWLAERAEALRPKVTVDFTKLDRIRDDAAAVREALLTDEEREDANGVGAPVEVHPEAEEQSSSKAAADTLFSTEEQSFLRLLLHGGDWQTYLRQQHKPLGVMMDAVNNKAMDWLGDVVLEDDGEGPKVIEDYIEDIEKELNK